MAGIRGSLDALDREAVSRMRRWGVPLLRVSIAAVFIWFGALKVFSVSPAAELAGMTMAWLIPPAVFVPVLGIWEMLIGICFLHRRLIRLGIAFLALHMPGTFLPFILLPQATFQAGNPLVLTMEGQYIVKNLLIISGALVVGSTLREK